LVLFLRFAFPIYISFFGKHNLHQPRYTAHPQIYSTPSACLRLYYSPHIQLTHTQLKHIQLTHTQFTHTYHLLKSHASLLYQPSHSDFFSGPGLLYDDVREHWETKSGCQHARRGRDFIRWPQRSIPVRSIFVVVLFQSFGIRIALYLSVCVCVLSHCVHAAIFEVQICPHSNVHPIGQSLTRIVSSVCRETFLSFVFTVHTTKGLCLLVVTHTSC
jgi:hypothetical protein